MRRKVLSVFGPIILALIVFSAVATADVKPAPLFTSHGILQRERPVPVWGTADSGEKVSVSFAGHSASTTADEDGKWMVELPPLQANSQPAKLVIQGKNNITLNDIVVGEVWVCSGQSNMEMGIKNVNNAQQEIKNAKYPHIRLFNVGRQTSGLPESEVKGTWKRCSPETIVQEGWGGFSAAGYFFARRIHKELDVPVGAISSNWGGTRIEPWTPRQGFKAVPELHSYVKQIDKLRSTYLDRVKQTLKDYEEWAASESRALRDDKPAVEEPEWPSTPFTESRFGRAGGPTVLYKGMIHALVPYGIRGALWYQGESNMGDGLVYHDKMKALIRGWRAVWGQGDFPFLYVQLAPWEPYGDGQLPEIWDAQRRTLSVPNTGMAVTTDVGDLKDIHPKNKQAVGRRLALWALARTYGKSDLVYSGPLFKSATVENSTVKVDFSHTGSGLTVRGEGSLEWFEIAGKDGEFVKATAKIEGDQVVVTSDEVQEPTAIRFGWDKTANPRLINKEGLPASPFRAALK